MRLLLAVLLTACLVTSASAMDEKTRDQVRVVYNFTANLYANIVRLISDLDDKAIEAEKAEEKVKEWTEHYEEQAGSAPSETRKMRELMNKMLKAAEDAVEDYDASNMRTKDALAALEEVKTELKQEMKDIKYLVE